MEHILSHEKSNVDVADTENKMHIPKNILKCHEKNKVDYKFQLPNPKTNDGGGKEGWVTSDQEIEL